jgi:hypothetical protein
LLDPGVPGRAHPTNLRHFFAPEPRRSPPPGAARRQADVDRPQLLAAAAKESAEQAPLVLGQQHGKGFYTRITEQLVTG